MSKNRETHAGLRRVAIVGGAVAVLSVGGLALVSQAQDKTADKAVQKETVVQKDSAIQSAALTPVKQDTTTPLTARPTAKTAVAPFRGDTVKGAPIMLRKPQAPARVQWSQAMDQASKMKSASKVQSVASQLDRKTLDRTRLPVILPRAGGAIQTAKSRMVTFGDAYALNMPQDKGIQITMYGNRSFVPTDTGMISKRPMLRLAGVPEDVRISQMEDGWTATFTRFGVVYSLDVTCDDINSDDCKTDSFIRTAIAQFDDVAMGADATAEAESQGVADPEAKAGNWLDKISRSVTKLTKGG